MNRDDSIWWKLVHFPSKCPKNVHFYRTTWHIANSALTILDGWPVVFDKHLFTYLGVTGQVLRTAIEISVLLAWHFPTFSFIVASVSASHLARKTSSVVRYLTELCVVETSSPRGEGLDRNQGLHDVYIAMQIEWKWPHAMVGFRSIEMLCWSIKVVAVCYEQQAILENSAFLCCITSRAYVQPGHNGVTVTWGFEE